MVGRLRTLIIVGLVLAAGVTTAAMRALHRDEDPAALCRFFASDIGPEGGAIAAGIAADLATANALVTSLRSEDIEAHVLTRADLERRLGRDLGVGRDIAVVEVRSPDAAAPLGDRLSAHGLEKVTIQRTDPDLLPPTAGQLLVRPWRTSDALADLAATVRAVANAQRLNDGDGSIERRWRQWLSLLEKASQRAPSAAQRDVRTLARLHAAIAVSVGADTGVDPGLLNELASMNRHARAIERFERLHCS